MLVSRSVLPRVCSREKYLISHRPNKPLEKWAVDSHSPQRTSPLGDFWSRPENVTHRFLWHRWAHPCSLDTPQAVVQAKTYTQNSLWTDKHMEINLEIYPLMPDFTSSTQFLRRLHTRTLCPVLQYCVGCKELYSLLGLYVEILIFFIVQQLVAFQLVLQLRSVPRW